LRKENATDPAAHTATITPFPPGLESQAREKAKAKRAKERKEKAKREKEKERKEKERGKEKEKEKAKRAKEKVKRIVAKGKVNSGVQLARLPIIHGKTVGRIQIVNSHGAKVAKVAKVVNHIDRVLLDPNSIRSLEVTAGLLNDQIHVTVLAHQLVKEFLICAQTSRREHVSLEMPVVTFTIRTGDHPDQAPQEVTGINSI